ncbi:MAG: hypothetical protein WCJ89_03770 [Actinomycetes bacterium]
MTMPPPPLPASSNGKKFLPDSNLRRTPGAIGITSPGNFLAEDIERASVIPVLTSGFAILISCLIWLTNKNDGPFLSLLGYLFSPFIVIICLGIDSYLQRLKISKFAWFLPNPNYSKILKAFAIISIAISYPHINNLASHISAWLAQVFPWVAS